MSEDKPIHEIITELGEAIPDDEWANICSHGGLKRKREICERDAEIIRLSARLAALEEHFNRVLLTTDWAQRDGYYTVKESWLEEAREILRGG